MKRVQTSTCTTDRLLLALALLLVACAVSRADAVPLPFDYEGDSLPQPPWSEAEASYQGSQTVSNGILTLAKTWSGEPSVAYRVNNLDFTSATGVTVDLRVKVASGNQTPFRFNVQDENLYFVFLLIWPDQIRRHRQNNNTPEEVDYADFTQWQTLRIEFQSRHLRVYLADEVDPIMDTEINYRYIGANPRSLTFGIPAGAGVGLTGGPAQAQVDYIRISEGTGGGDVPVPTDLFAVYRQSGESKWVRLSWESPCDEWEAELERQDASGTWQPFQTVTVPQKDMVYYQNFLGDHAYRWRVHARYSDSAWSGWSQWHEFTFGAGPKITAVTVNGTPIEDDPTVTGGEPVTVAVTVQQQAMAWEGYGQCVVWLEDRPQLPVGTTVDVSDYQGAGDYWDVYDVGDNKVHIDGRTITVQNSVSIEATARHWGAGQSRTLSFTLEDAPSSGNITLMARATFSNNDWSIAATDPALSGGAPLDEQGHDVKLYEIDITAQAPEPPTDLFAVYQQPSGEPAKVTLSWVSSAGQFRFQLERRNASGEWETFDPYVMEEDHVIYNVDTLLYADYRWHVQASNDGDIWSDWSAWSEFSFQAVFTAPTDLSPSNGGYVADTYVEFNWDSPQTAGVYWLFDLWTSSNGAAVDPELSAVQAQTKSYQYELSPGSYVWRVCTVSEADPSDRSDWTEWHEFVVQYTSPTLIQPINNAIFVPSTNQYIPFRWASGCAAEWIIEIVSLCDYRVIYSERVTDDPQTMIDVAELRTYGYDFQRFLWRVTSLADAGMSSSEDREFMIVNSVTAPEGYDTWQDYANTEDLNCNCIPDEDEEGTAKDTDADGMPNLWEVEQNENRPAGGWLFDIHFNEANFDFDSDGFCNRVEYLMSTDPHDAESKPLELLAKSIDVPAYSDHVYYNYPPAPEGSTSLKIRVLGPEFSYVQANKSFNIRIEFLPNSYSKQPSSEWPEITALDCALIAPDDVFAIGDTVNMAAKEAVSSLAVYPYHEWYVVPADETGNGWYQILPDTESFDLAWLKPVTRFVFQTILSVALYKLDVGDDLCFELGKNVPDSAIALEELKYDLQEMQELSAAQRWQIYSIENQYDIYELPLLKNGGSWHWRRPWQPMQASENPRAVAYNIPVVLESSSSNIPRCSLDIDVRAFTFRAPVPADNLGTSWCGLLTTRYQDQVGYVLTAEPIRLNVDLGHSYGAPKQETGNIVAPLDSNSDSDEDGNPDLGEPTHCFFDKTYDLPIFSAFGKTELEFPLRVRLACPNNLASLYKGKPFNLLFELTDGGDSFRPFFFTEAAFSLALADSTGSLAGMVTQEGLKRDTFGHLEWKRETLPPTWWTGGATFAKHTTLFVIAYFNPLAGLAVSTSLGFGDMMEDLQTLPGTPGIPEMKTIWNIGNQFDFFEIPAYSWSGALSKGPFGKRFNIPIQLEDLDTWVYIHLSREFTIDNKMDSSPLRAHCVEEEGFDRAELLIKFNIQKCLRCLDYDHDGMSDWTEQTIGTKIDNPDSDGDGVYDSVEVGLVSPETNATNISLGYFVPDAHPGSTTDPGNPDTDGDGIPDGIEDANWNGSVESGETDPNDSDSDNDGSLDGNPDGGCEDLNNNGVVDPGETDPRNPDSDEDGIFDGTEMGFTEPEGSDTEISAGFFVADEEPTTTTNPVDADSDDDGIPDGQEDANRNGKVDPGELNPLSRDTDGDGLPDSVELGLSAPLGEGTDMSKFIPDSDPSTTSDPTNPDSDGDGIPDGQEDKNRNGAVDPGETDSADADSDNDGHSDGEEKEKGSDPLDDESVPAIAVEGDCDGDGDVDRDDLNLIVAARNQPASGPDDSRDLDGDGMITALDARKLIVIIRSQPVE